MTTEQAGNLILFITTAGAVLGWLVYLTAPWWRTAFGRHAVSYMGVVALILVLLTVRNSVGDFGAYDRVRLIAYALGGVVVWWRTIIIIRSRWRDHQFFEEQKELRREREAAGLPGGAGPTPDVDESANRGA